jgi:glycosyltransferase involved in cell wall biosynthesis
MDTQGPDMKKVLVITYYWPPSGGGGVQRWLKFTKYLPEFGWNPIVLTPANPSVREQDSSLLNEVRADLKIVKIPIFEPYAVTSKLLNIQTVPRQGIVQSKPDIRNYLLTWMRGNFLIPDTRIFWRKPAFKKASKLIVEESIDLVITTGPPHSLHLIGHDLKTHLKIKWIADFRDPWSDWDILDQLKLTPWAKMRHKMLEQKVIGAADGVITVSNAWAKDLSERHQKTIKVITNGYDRNAEYTDAEATPDKFRISHFGLINKFRNVPRLWQVLGELCQKDQEFCEDLEIFLAGNIENSLFELFKEYKLDTKLNYVEYLPYAELPLKYAQTSVFLLLSNRSKNSKGHIPGKLFEYLEQGKPVLALSDTDGDVADIIIKTNSGYVADPEDEVSIRNYIMKLYEGYRKNERIFKQTGISGYERRNLTERLSDFMGGLIN